MAFQRRLSDHQLIAARWEYEATSISERNLAAKYCLSRSAIHDWIVKQDWTRAKVLRSYDGEAGQQQFQRDVRAAIKAARDKKIILSLERSLVLPAAGKETKETNLATRGPPGTGDDRGIRELSADRPQSIQNGPPGKPRRDDPGRSVVHFRGSDLPLPPTKTHPASAFPARSRTEQAAMRLHLAARRGELALEQIQRLEEHDDLLGDFQHLLAVYLNPGKYVDVTGLDPGESAARLEAIRQQAGRLVMPTERWPARSRRCPKRCWPASQPSEPRPASRRGRYTGADHNAMSKSSKCRRT